MNVSGMSIAVIGAAKSGLAAARSLVECGANVFVSDIQSSEKLVESLTAAGLIDKVKFESGGHTAKVLESDCIVLSPGVRTDIDILQTATGKNIPIYSEIEIAYRLSKGKRLVITGSNGKTTTTTLTAQLCHSISSEVFLGGNIGIPMMEFATRTTDNSLQVLEVSSFQLETIVDFKPDIAVITNFFENHLDRYPSYIAYIEAKKRISLNMSENDWLILNIDQARMLEMARETKCQIAWFGWNKENLDLRPLLTVSNGSFIYLDKNNLQTELFPISSVRILGRHNLENVMCACLAALLAGVDTQKMEQTVRNFPGVEHRLEWVDAISDITFINDSKGTNCAASITAMQACNKPLILIAGGRDKGTDLSEWVDTIRQSATGVVLYGEARPRFRAALEGLVPLKIASDFEQAINQAYQWANPGDTVLLSPACSSYDLFDNFEQRGSRFKQLVKSLQPK